MTCICNGMEVFDNVIIIETFIINRNIFAKLAEFVQTQDQLCSKYVADIAMLFELITSALKVEEEGQKVIQGKYLNEFIISINGYINIDLKADQENKVYTSNGEMSEIITNFLKSI